MDINQHCNRMEVKIDMHDRDILILYYSHADDRLFGILAFKKSMFLRPNWHETDHGETTAAEMDHSTRLA